MSSETIDKLKSTNMTLAKKMNNILEEKRLLMEERDKLKIESIKLDYTVKLNKMKANDKVNRALNEIEQDVEGLSIKLYRLRDLLGVDKHSVSGGFDNDLSQLNLSQNFNSTPRKSNHSSPKKQNTPTKELQILTIIDSPNTPLTQIEENNSEMPFNKQNSLSKTPLKPKKPNQPKLKESSSDLGKKRSNRGVRGNRHVDYRLPSLKKKLRRSE